MASFHEIRPLIATFGTLKAQPADDWRGNIALPPALAQFYAEIGPWGEIRHQNVGAPGLMFPLYGNPVNIPPLHKLWDFQAGYRWHSITGERIANWQDHWLVIAYEGGNPFILDTINGQILFDFAGSGGWQPQLFANDLPTAIGTIATVSNAVLNLDEDTAYDDSGAMTQAALDNIKQQLAIFLNNPDEANRIMELWQWA